MPQRYELNLWDYWLVIKRRKWIILLTILVVFGSTLIYIHYYQPPSVYRASTIVRITQQKITIIGLGGIRRITVSPGHLMPTQSQIITSWPVLEKVVKQLNLTDPDSSPEKVHQVVTHLRDTAISVEVIKQTDAIKISVEYSDPKMAVQIANKIAEVYIQLNLNEKSREARHTREFIGRRLVEMGKKLRLSEEKLKEFKEIHETTGRATAFYNQLADLEEKREVFLCEYYHQLADLEKERELLSHKHYDQIACLEKERDLCLRKHQARLIAMEKQRGSLLRQYTEKYPDVIRLNEDIVALKEEISKYPEMEKDVDIVRLNQAMADLKEKINKDPEMKQDPDMIRLNQAIAGLKEEISKYPEPEPELVRLNQKIAIQKEELSKYPEEEIEFSRLTRDVRINTTLYSALKQKFTSAEIEAEQLPDVTLVERAMVPTKPIKPKKPTVYIVALITALILGFSTALVVEHLDTSVRTIEEVEEFLKLPVLTIIPHIEASAKRGFFERRFFTSKTTEFSPYEAFLITQIEPESSAAEAFRTLRTNLQFRKGEGKLQTLVFTSASDKEGKSTLVVNCAIAMAQAGQKVVVVDADLRRPILHKVFGLSRELGLTDFLVGDIEREKITKGLTDILVGDLKTDKMMKPRGMESFHIITSGKRVSNPVELLNSQRMTDLIARLTRDFDVVLFDATPVLPVTDAALLAAKLDGTILVHRLGKISRGVLARAKVQLEGVQAKILGIILNDLRPVDMESGLPYYYYHYKGYYTEKKSKSNEV